MYMYSNSIVTNLSSYFHLTSICKYVYFHLKLLFRTRRPIILILCMKHLAMEFYKVCINHDPGMTLTYFFDIVNFGTPCI